MAHQASEGWRDYSTIYIVRGVVRPAFQMTMNDDLIRTFYLPRQSIINVKNI